MFVVLTCSKKNKLILRKIEWTHLEQNVVIAFVKNLNVGFSLCILCFYQIIRALGRGLAALWRLDSLKILFSDVELHQIRWIESHVLLPVDL